MSPGSLSMESAGFSLISRPDAAAPAPAVTEEATTTTTETAATTAPESAATTAAETTATPESTTQVAETTTTPPTVTATATTQAEPFKYSHEYVEKLDQFVRNGGDPKLFLETQGQDYDAMADEVAAKELIRQQYPGATAAGIDAMFRSQYKLDRELHAEEEVLVSEMKLKGDADRYRVAKKEEQAKYAIAPGVAAEQRAADEKVAWQAHTAPAIDSLKDIDLSFGAGETAGAVKFALTDKASLAALAQDPANVFQRWIGADGSPDVAKLAREFAILDNLPAILAQAASEAKAAGITLGRSQGTGEVFDKLQNTSRPGESGASGQGTTNGWGSFKRL